MGRKGLRLNSTNTFVIAWIIAQLNVLLASSEIAYTVLGTEYIRYMMYVIAASFLIVKMLILDKYTAKKFCAVIMAMILIGIVSYKSLGLTLILHGIFLVSLNGINVRKLIRADMKLRLMVVSVLFLLAITGIINNYSDVINGSLKYAFGWQHPNNFGYQVIIIIVESIYISKKRIDLKRMLSIFIVLIVLWTVCASRTVIFAFLVFMVLYLMAEKRILAYRKPMRLFLCSITPLCGVISWLLVWLYSQGNSFAIKMDTVLTSRLAYSARFLDAYPLTLWGSKIATVSSREHYSLGISAQILDMSYIRLPLEYGVVFFAVFIALYIAIQIHIVKRDQYREAVIIVFFSVLGIASTGLLSPFSNFSMLFLVYLMQARRQESTRLGVDAITCPERRRP